MGWRRSNARRERDASGGKRLALWFAIALAFVLGAMLLGAGMGYVGEKL